MRVLITGVSGFAGSHLADYILHQTACQVWGVVRQAAPGLVDGVQPVEADLRDAAAVGRVLDSVAPDLVFHLAAQAGVPVSWRDPWATLETNIHAQVNLLTALAERRAATRILVVGSEQEYGAVRLEDMPVDEDTPLRPVSPYAVSKIAQDMLGLQYFLSHQVQAVRVRPFPHIGPRQKPDYVAASWARQIAEIEAGRREPVLRVGNLAVARDYTDVRDVVRAYWLVLQQGAPGEVYNIGSGTARPIQTLLDILIGLSRVAVRVEVDPQLFRPADVAVTVCDPARLRAATGWEPTIPFEQTVRDILDDWRERVKST